MKFETSRRNYSVTTGLALLLDTSQMNVRLSSSQWEYLRASES